MHLSPNVNNIVLSVLPTIVLFQMLMVHLRNTQAFELDEPRTNLGNFAPVQPALFFAPFINDNVIDDNAGFLSGIAAGGSSGGRTGARRLLKPPPLKKRGTLSRGYRTYNLEDTLMKDD